MKRIKDHIKDHFGFYCFLLWATLFFGAWTYTYDTDTPAGTDAPSVIDDRIREVKDALQERLAVEHVFALTGSEVSGANTGKHTDITCFSVTSTGSLSGTTITGSGNLAINTNKFTVTAATGNTLVAGTLESTGVATLADASLLKTSAAPTTDAMIANKKYVDDTPHTGGIVQFVSSQTGAVATGSTVMPYDDTIPQNTEGVEYMTLAITPTSATNKLKIDVVIFLESNAGDRQTAALFQDSTANALAAGIKYSGSTMPAFISFTHYMTAGTTSATTFKVRAGGEDTQTVTFNGQSGGRKMGGVMASSITITEIKV